jgi:hypothetical protein
MEACSDAKLSFSSIVRCEDATDCAPNEACCAEWVASGSSPAQVCKPLRAGAVTCGLSEVCRSSCRQKGAACVEGVCEKPRAETRCGASVCSGATPDCCGAPPTCQAKGCLVPRYTCSVPSDCLPGEHCAVSVAGTACTRLDDIANTSVACASDKDCTKGMCLDPKGKPRCVAEDWLKVCACK